MTPTTRIIKLTRKILPLIILIMASTEIVRGQGDRISLPSREITAGELITRIEDQTPYRFAYTSTLLDTAAPVGLFSAAPSVDEALDAICQATGLAYVASGRYVSFVKREPRPEPAYRTSDRYRATNIRDISAAPYPRPVEEPVAQVETVIPQPEAPRPAPVFYSDYRSPDIYAPIRTALPKWAIKFNLLYAGVAFTPNLSVEIATGPRTTIALSGSYNPWDRNSSDEDIKLLEHYIIRPEFRWWMCERFNGHYVGVHAIYANYNIGQKRVPMLFKKDYHYEGWAAGAGFSYGYNLPLGNRWGLEFSAGVGAAYMKYDQFKCGKCGDSVGRKDKWYFGPTDFGVTLVFLFK